MFSSTVRALLHDQHTHLHTYKANSLLELDLIAFLWVISEEMAQLEQARSFPQPAMLKNKGEEATSYLSAKQDVILQNEDTNIPSWKPAGITNM